MKIITPQEVALLEKEITPIVKFAAKIEIKNQADMKVAVDTLSNINRYADEVKEKREGITLPLNEALKATRGLFKPLEEKLEAGVAAIRSAMGTYQTAELKRAETETEKVVDRVGDGKGKFKVETAVRKLEAIDVPESVVVGEAGQVRFNTIKKFEVVSLKDLPLDFHIADEKKIREVMRKGLELPGVKYWEEQSASNYR